MAGWLQKSQKRQAPVPTGGRRPPANRLPNATVIYGIGAALLFAVSLFLLMQRHWLPAAALFVIGMCLLGFALHLLKHQD